ncbi:MAG: hypothetical protein OXG78_10460 [Chloroflexi bacterium]|nr:hypothetical protein [Chloroflexota bacterium]
MSSQADIKAKGALDALTAGLQAGEDVDDLIAHSGATAAEAEGLVEIIQALHNAITPVEPGREFSERLRDELLGEHPGMVKRVRQMPARVHVAAALAVIAGCLLFVIRRIFGSGAPQEIQEEAVATPL